MWRAENLPILGGFAFVRASSRGFCLVATEAEDCTQPRVHVFNRLHGYLN